MPPDVTTCPFYTLPANQPVEGDNFAFVIWAGFSVSMAAGRQANL